MISYSLYLNLCPFRALGMNLIGLIFIVLLCVMDGCVIYAVYSKCDIGKFGMGKVTSNDQVQRLIIFIYLLFDRLSILRISVCFFRLIPLDFQSILPWPSGNFSLKLSNIAFRIYSIDNFGIPPWRYKTSRKHSLDISIVPNRIS